MTDKNTPKQPAPSEIHAMVERALTEDVGSGDVTAALVPENQQAHAKVFCREQAVICGLAWVNETFRQLDGNITLEWNVKDGDIVAEDSLLVSIKGPARAVLTGERTALNFLQTLSGTATVSAIYAEQVSGTQCKVLDTRKTIPGLRNAQKYAVRCGGSHNHRIGLYDAFLIKENHIISSGGIEKAIHNARQQHPELTLEVETENMQEFHEALAAGADIIMLDEFSFEDIRLAVQICKNFEADTKLEASGNINLDTLRDYAETGVDFVSSGSLTKHVRAIDLSMRFEFVD
ncbi:MAG: carboxylating nicotinate-nucleotide diphosphorylase [Gammaproteobacteria bacterium]|nr:carboxylating nicotinate-nucleotide diphosphorylase [Gammaproteobacteria bacterium]NNC98145.1 carboxylating nicotinate-nucleotide diphosphorylase [Gammaproteobacteria bacterium]NNM14384.1 carboxylating nicotinate-nucleotide diphosphorylase [Gammaproteobacteria bacterium]